MHRIHLHYTLAPGSAPATIGNPLLDLLQAVTAQGSITGAARALGLSYRHVWGELRRWETVLGSGLIVWEKGQAARLTPFATKLLWAERQAQARLAPQIEALRADLERAFAVAFDDAASVLTFFASHDEALAGLRTAALAASTPLHLDVRFTGSVDAIRALNEGRCTLAGFHTLEAAAAGTLAQRTYKPLLRPGRHKIIGFARRTQGLIVAPDNPLGLSSLADIARTGARFANRMRGSGTRLVLDELLAQAGVTASSIVGYAAGEPSQAAVVQAVAAGDADAGLGLEAAAQARGLGFVPLAHERYHLVCLKAALDEVPVRALLGVLTSPAWQAQLAAIPGHAPADSGEVLSLRRVLPWWHFRRTRASAKALLPDPV